MKKEALNTEEKEGQITYIIKMEEIISPYLHKEITDQVNKVSRDGDWSAGLNSMSDEQVYSIYSDVSEDFWSNHAPKEKYYEGLSEGKITKSKLARIIKEEMSIVLEEAGKDMDAEEAHMLGREHAVEVWRGEREDSDIMMMSNAAYRAGFEDATEEIAAEEGDDSLHRDPAQDYEDAPEEEFDDDGMWENKITKSKLAQIIKEELKAVLSESDVDPVEAGQDEDIQEMIYQQIADNLQDGPLPADSIFSLTEPEYESPYEHLADQWKDILAAALHEMSEGADATIEKSHDTMTGEPYYSPIGFLS